MAEISSFRTTLRVLLKDIDTQKQAFSDDELDILLNASLADFNAFPHFTNFSWTELEERWRYIVCLGAQIMALYAQNLIEAGREFNITDNGITFTPPPVAAAMQTTAASLLAQYTEMRNTIKGNMKPQVKGFGTFVPLAISPAFLRLRHLRQRRLV
jgi:hypothetical protein